MKFEIEGVFKNANQWQKFKKIVEAHNEKFAIEKVYSLLGSNHKVKRHLIKIKNVRVIDQSTSS
ncbi:MAG TPA: 50S ribosomal protein L18a [Archaeoglobus profundus]|nr:50S ribosomal protein L18a [Archaeoglobus profundus]